MKNIHEANILFVVIAELVYVFLVLTAICGIVLNGGVIGVAWGTLAALVLAGGLVTALVAYFFRRVELIDRAAYAA